MLLETRSTRRRSTGLLYGPMIVRTPTHVKLQGHGCSSWDCVHAAVPAARLKLEMETDVDVADDEDVDERFAVSHLVYCADSSA